MSKPGSAQKFIVNGDPELEMGVGVGMGGGDKKERKGKLILLRNCKESRKKNPFKQDPAPCTGSAGDWILGSEPMCWKIQPDCGYDWKQQVQTLLY